MELRTLGHKNLLLKVLCDPVLPRAELHTFYRAISNYAPIGSAAPISSIAHDERLRAYQYQHYQLSELLLLSTYPLVEHRHKITIIPISSFEQINNNLLYFTILGIQQSKSRVSVMMKAYFLQGFFEGFYVANADLNFFRACRAFLFLYFGLS